MPRVIAGGGEADGKLPGPARPDNAVCAQPLRAQNGPLRVRENMGPVLSGRPDERADGDGGEEENKSRVSRVNGLRAATRRSGSRQTGGFF